MEQLPQAIAEALAAISISRQRKRQRRPAELHRHVDYEILVFLAGSMSYQVCDEIYQLRRGDCLVIRSDEAHRSVYRSATYERLCIRFDPRALRFFAALGEDILACFDERPAGRDNRVRLNNRQTNALLERCQRMEDERLDALTEHHGALGRLHHLLGILLLLDAGHRDSQSVPRGSVCELVAGAIDHIDRGLEDPALRLEQIALALSCAPTYLSRRFKQEVGRGFKDYLLHRRMARAKHLLRGGASVTDACYGSGFNDYANFVKRFRQRCGQSPGTFRKQHLPYR